MNPQPLIVGSTGQLGTAFAGLLPSADQVDLPEMDLTDLTSIAPFIESQNPSLIINCAAYTAVDAAEDNIDLATVINGHAVAELARVADQLSVPFVTYSTDYVFDGTGTRPYLESDPVSPVNAYGASKLVGEGAALDYSKSLVVRTSWLVSGTHQNFIATMLRLARKQTLSVVDDQHGRPTIAADLAVATLAALDVGASGILHLANEGPTTWFELARAAVALGGGDPASIQPCTTSEYPTRAKRPAYSVLGSERLSTLGIPPLPHWSVSLPDVVRQLLMRDETAV